MDKKTVEAAGRELERALKSIEGLAVANDFASVETHWSAFLTHAGRFFTKLENGSKVSSKSVGWYSKKVHQRRTDPLLSYIWHARNADFHGLQEIAQLQSGSIRQVTPTPHDLAILQESVAKVGLPLIGAALVEITPPQVRLLPVVDRGNTFVPPAAQPVPYQAATAAIALFGAILAEAERLVA